MKPRFFALVKSRQTESNYKRLLKNWVNYGSRNLPPAAGKSDCVFRLLSRTDVHGCHDSTNISEVSISLKSSVKYVHLKAFQISCQLPLTFLHGQNRNSHLDEGSHRFHLRLAQ